MKQKLLIIAALTIMTVGICAGILASAVSMNIVPEHHVATAPAVAVSTPAPTATPSTGNICVDYLMRHNSDGSWTGIAWELCAKVATTHTPAQMRAIFGSD